jgi:hypothetical protein
MGVSEAVVVTPGIMIVNAVEGSVFRTECVVVGVGIVPAI